MTLLRREIFVVVQITAGIRVFVHLRAIQPKHLFDRTVTAVTGERGNHTERTVSLGA
jgi:hypothetical protein